MNRICCDICWRDLAKIEKTLSIGAQPAHFCERCSPFAEEYVAAVAEIIAGTVQSMNRSIQRFRNQFVQDRLRGLKVVEDASKKAVG